MRAARCSCRCSENAAVFCSPDAHPAWCWFPALRQGAGGAGGTPSAAVTQHRASQAHLAVGSVALVPIASLPGPSQA